jgi:hypothetical protein
MSLETRSTPPPLALPRRVTATSQLHPALGEIARPMLCPRFCPHTHTAMIELLRVCAIGTAVRRLGGYVVRATGAAVARRLRSEGPARLLCLPRSNRAGPQKGALGSVKLTMPSRAILSEWRRPRRRVSDFLRRSHWPACRCLPMRRLRHSGHISEPAGTSESRVRP